MKDGIYEDMPMADYLAIGRPTVDEETGELVNPEEWFVSSGIVKEVYWHTEFHALDKLTSPDTEGGARQALGSLVHTAILEPHLMDDAYVILPKPDPLVHTTAEGEPSKSPRSTAAYKTEVEQLGLANPGKELVEYKQIVAATNVQLGVERCEDAKLLIDEPGKVELTVIATDPETGIRLKGRFDKWLDRGWDVNLKGCRSAQFHRFQKDVSNIHFVGVGFYKYLAEWAGLPWEKSIILALELDPPHVAKPWEMYPDVIDGGERVTRWALDRLAKAMKTKNWPAYGDRIEGMALTEFAYKRIDERTAE